MRTIYVCAFVLTNVLGVTAFGGNEVAKLYSAEYKNVALPQLLQEYSRVSGTSVSNTVRQVPLFSFSVDGLTRDDYLREIQNQLERKGVWLIASKENAYLCVGDMMPAFASPPSKPTGLEGEYNLWVSVKRLGNQYCLKVSRKNMLHAPAWNPDISPCPLDLAAAMKLAHGKMQVTFPETVDWKLDSVSLNRLWYEGHWYYQFQFAKEVRKGWRPSDTIPVVVLLNGWMPDYERVNEREGKRSGGIKEHGATNSISSENGARATNAVTR